MTWQRIDRSENDEGTTITYAIDGSVYASKFILVQSRKRHILHANATGPDDTWDSTSYFVIRNGQDVKQFWRLSEAKEYAEEIWQEVKAYGEGDDRM